MAYEVGKSTLFRRVAGHLRGVGAVRLHGARSDELRIVDAILRRLCIAHLAIGNCPGCSADCGRPIRSPRPW